MNRHSSRLACYGGDIQGLSQQQEGGGGRQHGVGEEERLGVTEGEAAEREVEAGHRGGARGTCRDGVRCQLHWEGKTETGGRSSRRCPWGSHARPTSPGQQRQILSATEKRGGAAPLPNEPRGRDPRKEAAGRHHLWKRAFSTPTRGLFSRLGKTSRHLSHAWKGLTPGPTSLTHMALVLKISELSAMFHILSYMDERLCTIYHTSAAC